MSIQNKIIVMAGAAYLVFKMKNKKRGLPTFELERKLNKTTNK